VLVALAAATRFSSGILMGTGLAFYVDEAGGSSFAVGAVATAYFLGLMLCSPAWGAIADTTGRRRVLLVLTGAGATVATLPLFVLDAVWAQIGARAVYAAFAAGVSPILLTIVSAEGGDAARGRSLGFYNSSRAVGFAGGRFLGGLLVGLATPAALYGVVAGLSAASTLAVIGVSDPTPAPAPASASVGVREVASEVRRRLLPAPEDRAHLRRNGLRWLYVTLALRNVTVQGVMALMPSYLPNTLGLAGVVWGTLLAVNPAGQTVFMLAFGRVADAVGRKVLVVGGMAGSGAFALVAAGASLPASQPGRIAVAGAAFVLLAASFSALTTGALAFIGDVAPAERESELMGLRFTAKGVGGIVGPAAFGAVAGLVGLSGTFALGSSLAIAAAALAAVALVESRPEAADAAVPLDLGDD
jgi:MFS family permease